ncbi:MAG: hypothetical protein GX624_13060 [Actinobacteria bacterium]|nr:hypothetical protein [Actinomycetota bacterium]
MAHDFPKITGFGDAYRFALEAEQACADLAAAAGVLAPTQEWQDKLEEVSCTHDDRVQKLLGRRPAGDKASAPAGTLAGELYLGTLDAEPATQWTAAIEQLAQAEEDAARYHEEFALQCADPLELDARLFGKTAQQDRAVAAELRKMLG